MPGIVIIIGFGIGFALVLALGAIASSLDGIARAIRERRVATDDMQIPR